MQQKIKRDVRIVFSLHIDQITGCSPGKAYIVTMKRGDKIQATSSAATADREGNVIVNMSRVFTSTLQKDTDYKYKTKELKVRALELPRRTAVASMTYDLSKHALNGSFPARKLIVKSDDGQTQMFLKIEGTEEKLYNSQHSIDSASNASLSSYMRAPSSVSVATPSVRDKASESDAGNFSDFESVVESVVASDDVKGFSRGAPAVKSDTFFDREIKAVPPRQFSDARPVKEMPKAEVYSPIAEPHISKPLYKSADISTEVKDHSSVSSQETKTQPPIKVPTKRVVVSQHDIVGEVIDQISSAVRRDAMASAHQSKNHTSEGVRLTLSHFFDWKDEQLESFVLNFLAHLAVKVCQETRLLGEWLDFLTHVMYRSITMSIQMKIPQDIVRLTSVQFTQLPRVNISTFIMQEKELLRKLRGSKGSSVEIMIFWLAGLDSCASEIALLSVRPVQQVIKNFMATLTIPREICLTQDEKIVADTVLLCSTLDSVLSVLIPGSKGDIRRASPILRIFLVNLFPSIFCTIVSTIVRGLNEFAGKLRENSSNVFRVLTTLKWWARKAGLLSVLSHTLMPLVAYCDFVLFPDILRQNDDYRCFMNNWLPGIQNAKESMRGIHTSDIAVSASDSEDVWNTSPFGILSDFAMSERGTAESLSGADALFQSLLELLNGNHDEAAQVILEEELFPHSEFNGLLCTLSRPDLVLPLLESAYS